MRHLHFGACVGESQRALHQDPTKAVADKDDRPVIRVR